MNVRRGKRFGQALTRLIGKEADVRRADGRSELADSGMSRTEADHDDLESIEIAEQSCRSHERLDPLGVADVPRVHHDEVVDELVLAGPRVVARLRRYLRRVDPVRNHDDPLGPGSFGDEPRAHRLSDRNDSIGPAQVRAHDLPECSDGCGVRQAPEPLRRLGKHVLTNDDERDAETPRHSQSNRARPSAGRSCRE